MKFKMKWIRSKIFRQLLVTFPPHKRKKYLLIFGVTSIVFFYIVHDFFTSIPVRTISGRMVRDFRAPNLTDTDITLVTMYLNLGQLDKGPFYDRQSPEKYRKWMKTWAWVTNPVVAFFEDKDALENFRAARQAQPVEKTTVFKISRGELNAFSHFTRIREIFSNPMYPKHNPETTNPEYSCTMSSKVDVLEMAIEKGLINTKYVAWLDIGYFRLLREPRLSRGRPVLALEAPMGFNPDTIGFSEVMASAEVFQRSPEQIIEENLSWVATGLILATPELMTSYIADYRSARDELLDRGMASTCQQVVSALYSGQLSTKPKVKVSTYTCRTGQFGLYRSYDRDYYCLGFLCKQMAEGRIIDDTVVIPLPSSPPEGSQG